MTKGRKIRLAQLGAGYWGPNLIRNFVQLDKVDELTVCDIDGSRLEKVMRQYPRIKAVRSSDEIFNNPQIDAVVIAIPAELHFEYARKSLLSGKHVLVEKPLSMSAREAQELVSLAEERQKVLMVGHTFIYNAAVRKAKEYIDSGELGEIYYIFAQRLNLGMVRQDVNVLWNLAPHDISIILYWLEEDPSYVTAKGLTFLQQHIEDVAFIDLDFPSGRSAHIHVSWLDPTKTRRIVVIGSRKMLVYNDVSQDTKIIIYDKGIDKKNIIRQLPDIENFAQFHFTNRTGDIYIPKIDFEEPLMTQCRHFLDCILYRRKPWTDGRNGWQVTSVLERAQASLENSANRKRH